MKNESKNYDIPSIVKKTYIGLMTFVGLFALLFVFTAKDAKAVGPGYYSGQLANGSQLFSSASVVGLYPGVYSISNQIWPAMLTNNAGTNSGASTISVTNWTAIPIQGAKQVALQFRVQATNSASTSNIVWHIYRSLTGVAPTNQLATNSLGGKMISVEALGTITNVLSGGNSGYASTTNDVVTSVGTFTYIPKTTSVGNQSTDLGIGGCTTLYIGYVDIPAGASITNYDCTVYQTQ